MLNNPIVSVIIPCYNAEKYLADTIRSVLCQSFRDFEIILINDGSVDSTQRIIDSFGRSVRSESIPQSGVSAARNRGTSISTGSFIQYLDSDDLMRTHALGERVQALISSGADVAYSDWQKLEKNAEGIFCHGTIIARKIEDIHRDPQIALFTDFWAPPGALMYTRRIVEAIGGWNESLPIIQDARFLLDAALNQAKFIHVPGVGMDYRSLHSGSLSTKEPILFMRDCFNNAVQVEKHWKSCGEMNKDRLQALLHVYGLVARGSFENDRPTFEAAFKALKRLDPGYAPDRPPALSILSRLFGYRWAEHVALWYRRCKKRIKAQKETRRSR